MFPDGNEVCQFQTGIVPNSSRRLR